MLTVNGLYGHIQRNILKSVLLLAGFVVLVAAYWYGLVLGCITIRSVLWFVFGDAKPVAFTLEAFATRACERTLETWYVPAALASLWFTIAWFWHQSMIRAATRARPVERRAEPELFNTVETLAIAAGLPMPRVEIMETRALNAYASGLTPATSTIVVTRGLLLGLPKAELEAVLAHEMTHIRNGDVRLMVVALIFAGGLTFLGNLVCSMFSGNDNQPSILMYSGDDAFSSVDLIGNADEPAMAGTGIVAVLLSAAVTVATLALTHIFALMTQLAVSRAREFMADAGAVELTKDPDALISALNRISGHDLVPVSCDSMRAMMISRAFDYDDPMEALFATHPPVSARIASIERYAGGHDLAARPVRGAGSAIHAPADGATAFLGGRATFGRRRRFQRA